MQNQTEQTSKMKMLINELEYKNRMLIKMEDYLWQCKAELFKNRQCMDICENSFKIDVKKKDKFVKALEKTEKELEELRNLIIKQNELRKVSSVEFEEVFEQTKIQMNIRKNDLKKKTKDLKIKIAFCDDASKRNIACLTGANECLEKKIACLEDDIQVTMSQICKIRNELEQAEKEKV